MDRSMMPRRPAHEPPAGLRSDDRPRQAPSDSSEARLSFTAQMGDFLRRNANWFLIAGLALLLLQDIFGTHGVLAMRRSQVQVRQMQSQINQLDSENQRLENRVKALKTDPTAIERIAREEMGLKRPNEHVFWLDPKPGDGASGGTAAPPSSAAPAPPAGNP